MPIVKDKDGKYVIVSFDEYRLKHKNAGGRKRLYPLSDNWEKEQRVIVQDNGIFIEYRNDSGYMDCIEGIDYGKGVVPFKWEPNHPMGWKDPDGKRHACQWCFEDACDYDEYFHQYVCSDCHDLLLNPDEDDLMFLPPEDIDEW